MTAVDSPTTALRENGGQVPWLEPVRRRGRGHHRLLLPHQPRFEAGDPRYAWLSHTVFVGDLRPPTRGDRVVVDIDRVT